MTTPSVIPVPVTMKMHPGLIGSWVGIATATTVPLPPLKNLMTFGPDGIVIDSRRLYLPNSPMGPLLATPAHGAWQQIREREFAATIVLIYEGATDHPTSAGEVLAMEKVRFTLKLDETGDQLAGAILVTVSNLNGDIVFEGPGTYEATRIEVESLL